jgi:hypothetical protein
MRFRRGRRGGGGLTEGWYWQEPSGLLSSVNVASQPIRWHRAGADAGAGAGAAALVVSASVDIFVFPLSPRTRRETSAAAAAACGLSSLYYFCGWHGARDK